MGMTNLEQMTVSLVLGIGGIYMLLRILDVAANYFMQYTGHTDYTADDPATFACVGESDGIASWRTMQRRLEAMSELGIVTEFHHYPGLRHGFGLGTGTVAEGWIDQAVAFWEANAD